MGNTALKYVIGDLIKSAYDFDVVLHGCNCFNTFGAGFAKQVKKHFPEAFASDQKTKKGDPLKLGTFSYYSYDELTIVNAYTQFHYSRKDVSVEYGAVRSVFSKINKKWKGKKVGMPLIGAGLAKGDWEVIQQIAFEEMKDLDVTVVLLKKDQSIVQNLKVNPKYLNSYLEGIKTEELFQKDFEELFGNKCFPTEGEEDVYHHCDFWCENDGKRTTFDVKGIKKVRRSDSKPNGSFHWVEIQNVNGNKGWLYGKVDYFVFETEDQWVFVKSEKLKKSIKQLLNNPYSEKPEPYNLYTRKKYGRDDICTLIPIKSLKKIGTSKFKPLRFVD